MGMRWLYTYTRIGKPIFLLNLINCASLLILLLILGGVFLILALNMFQFTCQLKHFIIQVARLMFQLSLLFFKLVIKYLKFIVLKEF